MMTSLAARSDTTMFEFSVDKILETGDDGEIGKQTVAVVPQSFARFELASFRALSGFMASGSGIDPSPFSIYIDPDALAPLVSDFGQNMITAPDPSLPVDGPVTTIPPDVSSWTLVDSLTTRNFGSDVAPLTMVMDRQVLKTDCDISDDILPVYSIGSGIDPSPFRLHESLIRDDVTLQEVIVQADQLFLDEQPTTETELGLYFGEEGQVLIDLEDSSCQPPSIFFSDIDLWSDPMLNGQIGFIAGIRYTVIDTPDTASGAYTLGATTLGTAQCEAAFATSSSLSSEASAAVEGAGCGVVPVP
jgi:hypothetical protein